MKNILLTLSLLLLSTSVFADCTFKKAARNELLDQKIGISGKCDSQRALTTKATNTVNNAFDIDAKKIKNDAGDTKENIEGTMGTIKKVTDIVR